MKLQTCVLAGVTITLSVLAACQGKQITQKTENLQPDSVAAITEADRNRIFDCIDLGTSDAPVPLQIRSPLFSYFSENAEYPFEHSLVRFGKWPVLLYTSRFAGSKDIRTELVAFRGDTFGFHKSYFTAPLITYAARQKNLRLVFPGEFIYREDPAKMTQPVTQAPVMSLCHNRNYWFGYVGPEWPFLVDYGWRGFLQLLLPDTRLHLFAYSNGTVNRNLLLARTGASDLAPYTWQMQPKEYLDAYIQKTQANVNEPRIDRLIDIEGNFRIRKELWDLLAFLKTRYLDGQRGIYYAIVRMDKPDAFPVNVLMIQALGLQGVESEKGIIRYQNQTGNVVIDMVTRPGATPYRASGIDLQKATVFAPAANRKPVSLNHYSLIDFAIRTYASDFPHEDQ